MKRTTPNYGKERKIDRENQMNCIEIKITETDCFEIKKTIAKELYLGNRIYTSKAKESVESHYNKTKTKENEEYEIIGLHDCVTRNFSLMNKREYEEIMNSSDDENLLMKDMYKRITNGL